MPPTLYRINSTQHWEGLALLTPYNRDRILDRYISLVWTERFVEAGDVELHIPATDENYIDFPPGTLLGHHNSQEIMLLDTRNVEEHEITLTGKTLEAFFAERYVDEMTLTDYPGNILGAIVDNMQSRMDTESPIYGGSVPIPGLSTGSVSSNPGAEQVTEKIKYGPAYDELLRIAKKYNLGMRVVWVKVAPGMFELHFQTVPVKDHTRGNVDGNFVIRFARGLDNYANITELSSVAEYKTTALCLAPQGLSIGAVPTLRVEQGGLDDTDETGYSGWTERVVEVDCTDFTEADLGPAGDSDSEKLDTLNHKMKLRAKAELAKHRVSEAIDGEAIANRQYSYIREPNPLNANTYDLGAQVETTGQTGQIRKGFITEHVRSADSSGDRSYPTIAPAHPVPPVPPPDPPPTYENIFGESPGSVAKQPPIDFPEEPGVIFQIGWSSYLPLDADGNSGIVRVRWGKNDGSLHGKHDYGRLALSQPGRQIEASAGIDSGNVVVTATEIDTGGNNPRITDTIVVPEGAEWAQIAAVYPPAMDPPPAPPPPVL